MFELLRHCCTQSGVYAYKSQALGYLGEVTVEDGAGLVCEGNNTNNHAGHGDIVSARNGPITGVPAEKITTYNAHLA